VNGPVLDASALIAMLKAEPGADKVAAALADACISAVNLAEVVSHFAHLGMPPAAVGAMLQPLTLTIVPADTQIAHAAGQLRPTTARAGLSLGDRFCLALAQRDGAPAWTTDRAWITVAEAAGVEVVLVR
jgi:ribonuclease VapC